MEPGLKLRPWKAGHRSLDNSLQPEACVSNPQTSPSVFAVLSLLPCCPVSLQELGEGVSSLCFWLQFFGPASQRTAWEKTSGSGAHCVPAHNSCPCCADRRPLCAHVSPREPSCPLLLTHPAKLRSGTSCHFSCLPTSHSPAWPRGG